MKKLFSILGFLTFATVPFMSPLQVNTNPGIVTNEISENNYQLVELEKQQKPISDLTEYNNELYIGMFQGHLAKMNSEGGITQIKAAPTAGHKGYMYMKEFNHSLYLTTNTQLVKMTSNEQFSTVLDVPSNASFSFLEVFNNELYTTFSSLNEYSSLIKITANGDINRVLNFEGATFPLSMKVFNKHLYFASWNQHSGTTLLKIDSEGQIKQTIALDFEIEKLIEFNNHLYLFIDNGSIYTINTNDEMKRIKQKNSSFDPTAFIVFKDELYLGSNKLEKITKDNSIKVIRNIEIKSNIESFTIYNNELYLGMYSGDFAKIS